MPDDAATEHDDFDTDSLFGSPPASPQRGRSPSPLALPGGQHIVNNVGTLALPGSHLCSELPSALLSAPPVIPQSNARQTSQRVAEALPLRPPRPPPVQTTSLQAASSRDGSTQQRKSKRSSRRTTPAVDSRPTPPPIPLPSPTDPPPTNFLRNQQALLGHAGLISGVHPATLALQRHTRGESSTNPIVVEDEDRPMIGRRPLYGCNPLHGNLPVPSSGEILTNLVKQKNLVPVLDALIRLVVGNAPTYTSPYQYSYASSYMNSYGYPPPQPTSFHRPYNSNQPPPPPISAPEVPPPQPKRRKLSHVPAGAVDWDVPYPFPEGQGPPDYQKNWQKMRSQQLLDDLVGLIKSAATKAAVQKAQVTSLYSALDQPPVGSVEYYRDRILRNYGSYPPLGGPYAPYAATQLGTPSPVTSTSADSAATSSSSPPPTAPAVPRTFQIPTVGEPQPVPLPAYNVISPSSVPDSSTVASPVHPVQQADPIPVPQPPEPSIPSDPGKASESNHNTLPDLTQNNIDDLLAVFNDLPASDLDALLSSTDFSSFHADNADFMQQAFDVSSMSTGAQGLPAANDLPQPNYTLPDDFDPFAAHQDFDPSLFDFDGSLTTMAQDLFEFPSLAAPESLSANPVDVQSHPQPLYVQTITNAVASGSGAPPTPTLVGSPLSQVDYDPPTPEWNFAFPEPDIASGSAEGTPRPGTNGGDGGSQADGQSGHEEKGKGKGKERAVVHEVDAMGVGHEVLDASAIAHAMEMEATTTTMVEGILQSIAQKTTSDPSPSDPSTSTSSAPINAQDILEPLRKTLEAYLPPSGDGPQIHGASLLVPPPVVPMRTRSANSAPPPKPRGEVLRRARVMRAQLLKEIERAKIELWETTMEGGCLAVFAKERDKTGRT